MNGAYRVNQSAQVRPCRPSESRLYTSIRLRELRVVPLAKITHDN